MLNTTGLAHMVVKLAFNVMPSMHTTTLLSPRCFYILHLHLALTAHLSPLQIKHSPNALLLCKHQARSEKLFLGKLSPKHCGRTQLNRTSCIRPLNPSSCHFLKHVKLRRLRASFTNRSLVACLRLGKICSMFAGRFVVTNRPWTQLDFSRYSMPPPSSESNSVEPRIG